MKKITKLILCLAFVFGLTANAQVRISDTNNNAPAANAILELHSGTGNKGIVPPTAALTSLTDNTTIATPSAGMLIYSSGGTIPNGYYTWDGSKWLPFATGVGAVNVVAKSATGAIAKTETFIAASGDITLTLPAVTAADNGLSITVKNVGTYTDQVSVVGNGGATIDGIASSMIYRWKSRTYVAYAGNWLRKEKEVEMVNTFDVGPSESWTTIPEILAFLGSHMSAPSVIRLDGGTYTITATQTINLLHPLTIQGPSYGQAFIVASGAITDAAMFSCETEVSFKMIAFESGAGTFGDDPGENALNLVTDAEYHEIKDCTFDGFYDAIYVTGDVDMWLFECDITASTRSGIEINAGGAVSFFTSESDFTDCAQAIGLTAANGATVSVQNCTFTCNTAGQYGLLYTSGTFVNTVSLFFTNNAWNNTGTFVSGFDFSLANGRDANIEIVNNTGIGDNNPHCKMNVINNNTTTTITTAGTYYKANWTNSSAPSPVKWEVTNNKMKYLSTSKRDVVIYITGNLTNNTNSRATTVGIAKNGSTATIYGETTIRGDAQSGGTIVQFSTVVYIQNVVQNDYFEVYATSTGNGDVLTFSDINIYASAQ